MSSLKMNTWNDVMKEIEGTRRDPQSPPDLDKVRRSKMKDVMDCTKRPLIIYAVDFLNEAKARAAGSGVLLDWSDKEGFIEVIQDLPGDEVDILLHSSGGYAEAADSLVEIIRGRFQHVRFIVPNMAKSAATMPALSADKIIMDVASELGPIDPQFNFQKGDGSFVNAPAQAIIDQFEAAQKKIAKDPTLLVPWLPILQQYGPSLYQQAQNAIVLSKSLVKKWLMKYMFRNSPRKEIRARQISNYLGNHNNFKSHAKRIGINDIQTTKALSAIDVFDMRQDAQLQNRVWGLYHAITITFQFSAAYKLFESTSGRALIRHLQVVVPPGIKLPT